MEVTLGGKDQRDPSSSRARPLTHQAARELQAYNETVPMPIALSQKLTRV